MVHKSLKLLAPLYGLPLASFEAQRGLLRRGKHDAIVELDPIRLIGILGSVDDGIIVPAVVGLTSMHSHSEQHILFIMTGWSLLQEAKIYLVRVLKFTQDLGSSVQRSPEFVPFEVEEYHVRQRTEFSHLAHHYLAILVSVDLVVHHLLLQ